MSDPRDPVRATLGEAEDIDADLGDAAGHPDVHAGRGHNGPPDEPPAPTDAEGDPPPEAKAAGYPLNDIGNGQRFATYFGEDVVRVPRIAWHVWCGTHWAKDDDDLKIRAMAQSVSPRILDEIPHLVLEDWERTALTRFAAAKADVKRLEAEDELSEEQEAELEKAKIDVAKGAAAKKALAGRRQDHVRFAKSTGNSGRIDAMLREAGIPLARKLDELDADPMAINCLSGTIRFDVSDPRDEGAFGMRAVTARVDPHDRKDLITNCIPAEYDPGGPAPESKEFDAFLRRIQPNEEMRSFIQRWFGLSMTGIPVQKLAFLYGHGANGKSVLVDLICRIMDTYAASAPIEALTGQSRRGGSDATPELMPLIHARIVRASEPEQGERFKESMIKSLTSGEPVAVRALHSDFVFIKTYFKMTISGNHKPEIRGTDDGIWRRVLLIPFDVQIPEAERDPDLGERLWQKERDGVLAWMIDGLVDYLQGGLRIPDQVIQATDGYRKDSDPVGAFLTECAIMDGDDFILSKDMIDAFNFWLEENGETRWGGRTVSLRLKDKAGRWRHPVTGKSMVPAKQKATGYRGVRLVDPFRDRFERRNDGPGLGSRGELEDPF